MFSRDYFGGLISKSGKIRKNNVTLCKGSGLHSDGNTVFVSSSMLRRKPEKVKMFVDDLVKRNWK